MTSEVAFDLTEVKSDLRIKILGSGVDCVHKFHKTFHSTNKI